LAGGLRGFGWFGVEGSTGRRDRSSDTVVANTGKAMRVGLVRHFEVKRGFPRRWLTARELQQWRVEYEESSIIPKPVDLGVIPWQRCLCSDADRAVQTAQAIHQGPIVPLAALREVTVQEYGTGRLRLPPVGWRLLTRLAWAWDHPSQRESRRVFFGNLKTVVQEHLQPLREDLLVVSHGGLMWFLRKELIRLGYRGPNFMLAENGKLYVFERTEQAERG